VNNKKKRVNIRQHVENDGKNQMKGIICAAHARTRKRKELEEE
jgi:hypothetical protein